MTLSTLPVKILHQIFEHLDETTFLLSVRNVCQRLRATVDTYNRYKLDLRSISKRDFRRLLRVIHPECVTVLSLSNAHETPGQISVFQSLIDIGLFTQLRSLTLLGLSGQELSPFLEHARRCSLTSLTLDSEGHKVGEEQRIAQHLSAIIGQPTFFRLQFLSRDL